MSPATTPVVKKAAKKAVAAPPAHRNTAQHRLNRIEGQVRGVRKMIDEGRYCADILQQISSIEQALRGLSRQLMENHLRHCATTAIRKDAASAEEMYAELLDLIYKHGH